MKAPSGFIYLLGRAATPGAAETRQFLSRNDVGFRWVDVDDDPLARVLSADRALAEVRFPCALFEDGSMLEGPAEFMRGRGRKPVELRQMLLARQHQLRRGQRVRELARAVVMCGVGTLPATL